jgi:hypothetical protein
VTNETTIATMAPADDAQHAIPPEVMEKVVIGGDLSELNAAQRADYYTAVCRSLGLNPLTKPFEFLTLNGKLRLYALRDCADQLRRLHGISIYITNRERMGDIYIVTARAKDRTGREDESTGAVPLGNLKGDALANALMKAETKSKRRVTLSIASLGWLDETELATIPGVHTDAPDAAHDITGMSHPLPVGEDGTPGAATPPATNGHPTESHLAALRNLAVTECQEPVDVYEDRIRTTMKIPKQASVAPKLLTRTMTMQAYMELFAYYRRLEAQLAKGKETPGGTVPTPQPAAQPTPPPTGEGPTASPSHGSSSAPGSASDVDAREKLRQEALSWQVNPAEIEHILKHHDLAKARGILWKSRRNEPPPVWEKVEASAAD